MFDITKIQNLIVRNLYTHTGIPVVPTNDVAERPPHPYHSYNFIVTAAPRTAGVVLEVEEKPQDYIEYTRWELPSITISFNTHSDKLVECREKALELRSWFEFAGYPVLKAEDIIVTEVTAAEDRSQVLDAIEYQYRVGFDVRMRVVSESSRMVETINEVTYK